MQLLRVSEIAKTLRKSRNQVRGLILKHSIKSIEKRANIYGGITNYYNLEDFLNSNTTSEWLKWALRSGLQRDPIGVATDAEQLFVILAHRLEAILLDSGTPPPKPECVAI